MAFLSPKPPPLLSRKRTGCSWWKPHGPFTIRLMVRSNQWSDVFFTDQKTCVPPGRLTVAFGRLRTTTAVFFPGAGFSVVPIMSWPGKPAPAPPDSGKSSLGVTLGLRRSGRRARVRLLLLLLHFGLARCVRDVLGSCARRAREYGHANSDSDKRTKASCEHRFCLTRNVLVCARRSVLRRRAGLRRGCRRRGGKARSLQMYVVVDIRCDFRIFRQRNILAAQ